MKKVDVFVVGGAKCGTTWLHNMLCQREDVSMPGQKETNFFAYLGKEVNFKGPHDDENTNKYTVRDVQTYHALFRKDRKFWIEVCPSYLYVEGTAGNIFRYNKDARIIIILRNPVDRAWSNYQHLVRDGAESGTFEEALRLEKERSAAGWSSFWDVYRQGLYTHQVAAYLACFPRASVYVVRFEDIHDDPKRFMQGIEQFVGLTPHDYNFDVEKNESGAPMSGFGLVHKVLFMPGVVNRVLRKALPIRSRKKLASLFKKVIMRKNNIQFQEQTRKQLLANYQDDICALEQLVGMDFSGWGRE